MALLLATSGAGCVKTDMGFVSYSCAHPAPAPLSDRRAAIIAARKMWICISGNANISGEADWVADMKASLVHGIWEVGEPPLPEGYAGGGLTIFLDPADGHLINYHLTQ